MSALKGPALAAVTRPPCLTECSGVHCICITKSHCVSADKGALDKLTHLQAFFRLAVPRKVSTAVFRFQASSAFVSNTGSAHQAPQLTLQA